MKPVHIQGFEIDVEKLNQFMKKEEEKLIAMIDSTCGFSRGPVPPGKYRCSCCNGVFNLNQSPEWQAESKAEMERDFVGLKKEDAAIVCDDCYQKYLSPEANPQLHAEYKASMN
jgi:hypothetical protein